MCKAEARRREGTAALWPRAALAVATPGLAPADVSVRRLGAPTLPPQTSPLQTTPRRAIVKAATPEGVPGGQCGQF